MTILAVTPAKSNICRHLHPLTTTKQATSPQDHPTQGRGGGSGRRRVILFPAKDRPMFPRRRTLVFLVSAVLLLPFLALRLGRRNSPSSSRRAIPAHRVHSEFPRLQGLGGDSPRQHLRRIRPVSRTRLERSSRSNPDLRHHRRRRRRAVRQLRPLAPLEPPRPDPPASPPESPPIPPWTPAPARAPTTSTASATPAPARRPASPTATSSPSTPSTAKSRPA